MKMKLCVKYIVFLLAILCLAAASPVSIAPPTSLHAAKAKKGAQVQMESAKASAIGIVQPPPPPAVPTSNITLQWTPDPAWIVAYDFYLGTNSLSMPHYATITNWVDTNGLRTVTISGLRTDREYFAALDEIATNGDTSTKTDDIDFITPGYLLIDKSRTIRFWTSAAKTYSLQSTTYFDTWKTELTVANYEGITTFTNAPGMWAKFFRLQIH